VDSPLLDKVPHFAQIDDEKDSPRFLSFGNAIMPTVPMKSPIGFKESNDRAMAPSDARVGLVMVCSRFL